MTGTQAAGALTVIKPLPLPTGRTSMILKDFP
jgi:hypothetical protein